MRGILPPHDTGRPLTSVTGDAVPPPPESVRSLGEFGLIKRILALLPPTSAVTGAGDDAAVLDLGGPDYTLATVDMLVQDVHFVVGEWDPVIIGRRAIAGNVSDIAAMGGEPSFALVSLALPASCPTSFIDGLYRGMMHEAALTDTGVVGGNLARTDGPICVDVMLLGRVPRDETVLRHGARAGDLLVVTGSLGNAAAWRLSRSGAWPGGPRLPFPPPRVATGRALASRRIAHAMLDLSDGLAGDLHHLCEGSRVGALVRVDDLPVSPEALEVGQTAGIAPAELALSGGEDFELLLALAPEDLSRARVAAGDVPLTVIGEILPFEAGVALLRGDGAVEPLPPGGWTHF